MDKITFDTQFKTIFPNNPLYPAIAKAGFSRVGIAYLRAALLKNSDYKPVEIVVTELNVNQKEELQQLFREKGHNQRLILSTRRNLCRVKTQGERAEIMAACKAANDRINEVQSEIDRVERGEVKQVPDVTESTKEDKSILHGIDATNIDLKINSIASLIARLKRRIAENKGDVGSWKRRMELLENEKSVLVQQRNIYRNKGKL